ncbi:serine/threonine-protein kinase [Myxococcus sp. CA039A]|uniref:serine/threonine-protein kinase n=1 Tax=Myxococcus sp. CA039A TaxID=2741737 RepID=UPI00157B9426|nr:serine/threonine-protein kinase [Myxococcus sp. CA039A]NTX55444.1 serine/threonine protein kinase [Myxococcus sp. CA039A]
MQTELHSTPLAPPSWGVDTLVGQVLHGRFQVLEAVGPSGPARLYRALHLPLEREVALRVLSAPLTDQEARQRFFQEARVAARLAHPNTVTVLDAGRTDDGTLYVTQEWLEGRTLAHVLTSGALPWARAVELARGLGRSLRQAHRRGVVHGDMTPAYIMLVTDAAGRECSHVKVRGFGRLRPVVAESERLSVPDLTGSGSFHGAHAYMAPERARGVADARGDIYSLGVVLFQMLMGRVPFESEDALELVFAHHKEPVPGFGELRPDLAIPASVEAVVRRCLEKRPEQRFASMDAVLEALRDVGVEEDEAAEPVRAMPRAYRTRTAQFVGALAGFFKYWSRNARVRE